MAVFVSGATGYIGGAITRHLAATGAEVFAGVRGSVALPDGVTPYATGDLQNFTGALPPVVTVIHAAGLGHRRGVPAGQWRAANIDAAANLARAARTAGAKRFILVSTAHVHGRVHDGVVRDDTPPNPMDDYAASKLAAEAAVAAAFGPGLATIRPVAVTGPGAPGNLQLLMKLLARGVPLPFAAIDNRRSFIDVDDLARLIMAVSGAETMPGSVLAAQPESISTPMLISTLADGMGVAPRLLPCPAMLLAGAARLTGRAAMWQSLAGSFVANPGNALALGWAPAQSLRENLRKTARYYSTTKSAA